jgi:hypothetical protein
MTLPGLDQVAVADTTVALVAQPPPTEEEEPGGRGEDFGKSSPVGLLVILLFFVAVAFLVRSMTKHLKRVPESFDEPEPEPEPEEPAEPADRGNGESDSAKS